MVRHNSDLHIFYEVLGLCCRFLPSTITTNRSARPVIYVSSISVIIVFYVHHLKNIGSPSQWEA